MSEQHPRTESELVDFLRSIDEPAPAALHDQIETLVAEHSRGSGRRRRTAAAPGRAPARAWLLGGGAVVAAVVLAVLVAALSGGSSPTLTLRAASAPTLRAATRGAPAENPRSRGELAVAVDGVAFPYWEGRFGWRASGARSDRVDRRTVTTVFYTDDRGRRMGYAIVAGTPAPGVGGGVVAWRGATAYRLSSVNGVPVVTWLRDGHLCILSGRGVDGTALLRLASWSDRSGVAS